MDGISYSDIRNSLDKSTISILKLLHSNSKLSKGELSSQTGLKRHKLESTLARLQGSLLIKELRSSENLKTPYFQITEHGEKVFEII